MKLSKNVCLEAINKLTKYCEKRGWEVEFSRTKADEAFPDRNLIILNSRHKTEILFYFFLHEIGHMIMWHSEDYEERYGRLLNKRSVWSQTYRVCRVEEELEAWNTGLKFAKDFSLPYNKKKFEELKASMVSSYMLWANQRKHPHKHYSRYTENSSSDLIKDGEE